MRSWRRNGRGQRRGVVWEKKGCGRKGRGHGRPVRWAWSSGVGEKGGFREKSGGAWSGRAGQGRAAMKPDLGKMGSQGRKSERAGVAWG